MADPRFFAKLDLGYFENPKISDFLDDDPRVPILHLRAILYCRQHLTDGVFPVRQVARLASATYCGAQCDPHSDTQCDFCKAHDAGIFHRIDDRMAEVHDYLQHQEPARKVDDRSAAAQKAANIRWERERAAARNATGNAARNATGNAEERRGEESSSAAPPRPEVEALCARLADRIEANGAKRPTISKTWLKEARLLLDADKREYAEAEQLIDWCQADDFWRGNVLSMAKLRAKYDQLKMQAQRGGSRAALQADPWAHVQVIKPRSAS